MLRTFSKAFPAVFAADTIQEILAALTSFRETGANSGGEPLEKLGDFFQQKPREWVTIDLSDWSRRADRVFKLMRMKAPVKRIAVTAIKTVRSQATAPWRRWPSSAPPWK